MAYLHREFVVFVEYNLKENETYFWYLQWTGNEEKLTALNTIINSVNFDDFSGEKPLFAMDISLKLPEHLVDLHTQVININSFHKMFNKCTGSFTLDTTCFTRFASLDNFSIQDQLIWLFSPCKIERLFTNFRHLYKELLDGKITRDEYIRLSSI